MAIASPAISPVQHTHRANVDRAKFPVCMLTVLPKTSRVMTQSLYPAAVHIVTKNRNVCGKEGSTIMAIIFMAMRPAQHMHRATVIMGKLYVRMLAVLHNIFLVLTQSLQVAAVLIVLMDQIVIWGTR
ncbi:uncharacterized protein LOC117343911 [Pecten maximus]|uniref:uncharacterized protein LOC117343911 n=1 Tax=Pecten maximus TaxID=6579 RepID=UPI00145833B3|nr:uncharacterized protein LOC117343911 [Pecten maximus]